MIFTNNFKVLAEAYKFGINNPIADASKTCVIKVTPAGETLSTYYLPFDANVYGNIARSIYIGNPNAGSTNIYPVAFVKTYINRTTGKSASTGGYDTYPQLVFSYDANASENANDRLIDYDTILNVSASISQTRYRGIVNGKVRYVWKGVITNTANSALTFNQIGSYIKFTYANEQYGAAPSQNLLWLMMWKHVFSTPVTIQPSESATIAIVYDIDIGDESEYADVPIINF